MPPLQTDEGVETAARNIRAFARGIGRPVAIETGAAYFKRKPFEMSDGAFVARVAEEADCGILLDLHNIYCNERNGRITLDAFLAELPLDRVWEIHLAGGAEMMGYWLDSHSGPMPPDLIARSIEIVKSLPNLGAINFEIYDTFLERIDIDTLDAIVENLRMIWSEVGRSVADASPVAHRQPISDPGLAPTPASWEHGLTEAVWRNDAELHPWRDDAVPLKLYSWLARSFRGSMLARTLPRAMRYLLLRDGEAVEGLLERYYSDEDPKLYSPLEAQAFRDWLLDGGEMDRLLVSLLNYDIAFMKLIREGQAQVITFPPLGNLKVGGGPVTLKATSDSGLPVEYYVAYGPARIAAGKLEAAEVPGRATFPIPVKVVAYQFGSGLEPQVKTAASVERKIYLEK